MTNSAFSIEQNHRLFPTKSKLKQITTMKTTYQVWGYDSKRHDFKKDLGKHDDLKIAIQIAEYHTNAIVKELVINKNGSICDLGVIHGSFDSDKSEAFFTFKNKFPDFFL